MKLILAVTGLPGASARNVIREDTPCRIPVLHPDPRKVLTVKLTPGWRNCERRNL